MIKVCIIGCGKVVDEHYVKPLLKLQRQKALKVVALVDPSPERRQQIGRHFPAAGGYGTAEEAFAQNAIELTIIASPPKLHAGHGLAALKAGSHVLCEKPMTTNSDEAQRLNAAAREAKRIFAVGQTRRFSPNLKELAARIQQHELGENLTFTFREGGTYGWSVGSAAPFRREIAGGGVLADKGVHLLDTLSYLFGVPTVKACRDDSLKNGVETNSVLDLEFPNAKGIMQISWEHDLNNGLRIQGNRGEVWLDPQNIETYHLRKNGDDWRLMVANATWPSSPNSNDQKAPESYYDCFYLQLVAMVRAIQFGEPVPVTGEQAAAVIKAIEDAYSLAQPLDFSWLPANERQAMNQLHWKIPA